MLLALLGAGSFLEGMCEALLCESRAAGDKAFFVGFFRGENGDDVVFGVGLIALMNEVSYLILENSRGSPSN